MKRALAVSSFAAFVALAGPSLAHAAPVARPNPALVQVQIDYVNPLRSADGGIAQLVPLERSVISAAISDQSYLRYILKDDLGGFRPAPIGGYVFAGGRRVVGASHRSQIPQYDQAATGKVQIFALTGGTTPVPSDNGTGSVPGLGVPPSAPPPTNTDTVPPANQGFGGTGAGARPATTSSGPTTAPTKPTTTTKPPPTTTSPRPPTTTTAPPPTTTTTPPSTTTATPPTTTTSPPPTPVSSCGTLGLSIESDLQQCKIYAVNMAPGDATYEHMTIRNDSGAPFTLSVQASGTQNQLWNDLEMGVWEYGTAAPSVLPPLLWWTAQANQLTTLQPGQTITYVIELYLPTTAGNDDQGWAAVIDFNWHAQG